MFWDLYFLYIELCFALLGHHTYKMIGNNQGQKHSFVLISLGIKKQNLNSGLFGFKDLNTAHLETEEVMECKIEGGELFFLQFSDRYF